MSSLQPVLDPAIEEVLSDIARDPRSSLFVVDPTRLARGLARGSTQISNAPTGATPAEAHLLATYRVEVAELLVTAYREAMLGDETHRGIYLGERVTQEQWNSNAAKLLGALTQGAIDPALQPGAEAVRGVSNSPRIRTDRAAWLRTALRLTDTPRLRLYLAIDHAEADRFETSWRVALRVFESPGEPQVRSFALHWCATALSARGRDGDAADVYMKAVRFAERTGLTSSDIAIGLAMLCAVAIAAGRELDALESARRLDGFGKSVEPIVQARAAMVRRAVRAGFGVSPEIRDLAVRVADRVHPTSRQVFDALL